MAGDAEDKGLIQSLGTFNLIYSTYTLHHWENPRKVIDNLMERLTDNGILFLHDLRRVWWLYCIPLQSGFFTSIRGAYIATEIEEILRGLNPECYEIRNEMKVEVMKSGNMEAEFPWPSVTSVTKGINVDHKNRIWVLTYLKKPNKLLSFDKDENLTDCYEFDVFDSNGILLFKIPFPNVRFDNFSIYSNRIYLIDSTDESCVYEYRIIE